jgi:hypothetical protein
MIPQLRPKEVSRLQMEQDREGAGKFVVPLTALSHSSENASFDHLTKAY